jgi:hypothetical protein
VYNKEKEQTKALYFLCNGVCAYKNNLNVSEDVMERRKLRKFWRRTQRRGCRRM